MVGVVGKQAGLGGLPMAQALSGLVQAFAKPASVHLGLPTGDAPVPAQPGDTWADALVVAGDARRARQDDVCLGAVVEAIPSAGELGRRWLAHAALPCALALKNPARVDSLLTGGGASAVELQLVVARALLRADEAADALSLLESLSADTAATRRDLADLLLEAYLASGHLDRAAAMARSAAASPAARWRVAHALLRQNRVQTALPVMRPICAELEADDRERCTELYDTLQGW